MSSVVANIYLHVLKNMLSRWAEENEKSTNCQYGFRAHRSTTCIDCIYLFHAIIANTLSRKEKLYTSFVEYRKAFNSFDRRFMLKKLVNSDVSTKMVNATKAMYNTVKLCVKYNNKVSHFFNSNEGVKQGHPMSTT